jgi:hypothetical protein
MERERLKDTLARSEREREKRKAERIQKLRSAMAALKMRIDAADREIRENDERKYSYDYRYWDGTRYVYRRRSRVGGSLSSDASQIDKLKAHYAKMQSALLKMETE